MIADRVHYVLDIETLGVRDDAIIASIGIVYYMNQLPRGGFYTVIDLDQPGRTDDPATLAWWADEERDVARNEFLEHGNPATLADAVHGVEKFIRKYPDAPIWGNGSDFDNRILAHAFSQHGLQWPYQRNSCLRTLRNLVGGERYQPTTERIKHIAINDAMAEAEELLYLLGRITVQKSIDEKQKEIERDRAKGARRTDHRLAL